jgi:hypothetical protein
MFDRRKKVFSLALTIFFFLVVSCANLFHTEKTPFEDQKCPACNLQHSTQGIEFINVFHPPAPDFAGFLEKETNASYIINFNQGPSSRDPPYSNLLDGLI